MAAVSVLSRKQWFALIVAVKHLWRDIAALRQMGSLNVEIRLRAGEMHTKIYLSLDKPDVFIAALRTRLPQ